ncbi:hypothetical protein [Bacillus piscicola]|uniref:hypothetical protein n=1 Tax=Bacillus piscicola TaxID=1632684 RepID=UPI001F08E441|nr:hypothetical protein [Bacillus piscicola]
MLKASIKKIEIMNVTKKEEWHQSVRVILGDIELNNDNFIALRKFRPDEIVHVSIESAQRDAPPAQLNEQQADDMLLDSPTAPVYDLKDEDLIEEGETRLGEGDVVEEEFPL